MSASHGQTADGSHRKWQCKHCSYEIPVMSSDSAMKFCPICGRSQAEEQEPTKLPTCWQCGKKLLKESKFCDECGASVISKSALGNLPPPIQESSHGVAIPQQSDTASPANLGGDRFDNSENGSKTLIKKVEAIKAGDQANVPPPNVVSATKDGDDEASLVDLTSKDTVSKKRPASDKEHSSSPPPPKRSYTDLQDVQHESQQQDHSQGQQQHQSQPTEEQRNQEHPPGQQSSEKQKKLEGKSETSVSKVCSPDESSSKDKGNSSGGAGLIGGSNGSGGPIAPGDSVSSLLPIFCLGTEHF